MKGYWILVMSLILIGFNFGGLLGRHMARKEIEVARNQTKEAIQQLNIRNRQVEEMLKINTQAIKAATNFCEAYNLVMDHLAPNRKQISCDFKDQQITE